jgi:hypothetical protein
MSSRSQPKRDKRIAQFFRGCGSLLLAMLGLSIIHSNAFAIAMVVFLWASAFWEMSPDGPLTVAAAIPTLIFVILAHKLSAFSFFMAVTLVGILCSASYLKLRFVEGVFWKGLSGALAPAAAGLLSAVVIALIVRWFGVPAVIVARFQNGIVEICFLLESFLKPSVLIPMCTLALGLSFLVQYSIVKNWGKLVASLTFVARSLTVLSCLAFVAEPSAKQGINQSINGLYLRLKNAEAKVELDKSRYLSTVFLNDLVQDSGQRDQLARDIQTLYKATNGAEYLSIWHVFETVSREFSGSVFAEKPEPRTTWEPLPERPKNLAQYVTLNANVEACERQADTHAKELSKKSSELREGIQQILATALSMLAPELPQNELSGAIKIFCESWIDTGTEAISTKLVEKFDFTGSVAQVSTALRKAWPKVDEVKARVANAKPDPENLKQELTHRIEEIYQPKIPTLIESEPRPEEPRREEPRPEFFEHGI